MSIIETNTIDIDHSKNSVILTISDHLDWSDELHHIEALQSKINAYLEFIESEQIYETHPQAKELSIEIEIVSQYEISQKGLEFLNVAKSIIKETEVEISQRLFEE